MCVCGVCLARMYCHRLLIVLLLFVLVMNGSVFAAPLPRMRPYTGIGVVVFPGSGDTKNQNLQLQLYEEPGLSRIGLLNSSSLSGNEWVFGQPEMAAPLIVSARKGVWLRVFFDDAGREAWINPENKGQFQSWEQFLRFNTGRMLPALKSQHYQLLQNPGGKLLATLTPKHVFKVLKLESSWGMVLTEQGQIGWVLWSDGDGRLMVGTGKK